MMYKNEHIILPLQANTRVLHINTSGNIIQDVIVHKGIYRLIPNESAPTQDKSTQTDTHANIVDTSATHRVREYDDFKLKTNTCQLYSHCCCQECCCYCEKTRIQITESVCMRDTSTICKMQQIVWQVEHDRLVEVKPNDYFNEDNQNFINSIPWDSCHFDEVG